MKDKILMYLEARWLRITAIVIATVSVFMLTPDQYYNILWTVTGLLLLAYSITCMDRYWSRGHRGKMDIKQISLTKHMQKANDDNKTKIYCSLIIGVSFIIGQVMGGN